MRKWPNFIRGLISKWIRVEHHSAVQLIRETQGDFLVFRLTKGPVTGDAMTMVYDKVRTAVDQYVKAGGNRVFVDVSKVEFRETDFLIELVYDFSRYEKQCRVAVNLGREPTTAVDYIFRPLPCFVDEPEAVGYLQTDSPEAYLARRDYWFWRIIGSGVGPERCRHEGCEKLRVRLSAFCKWHHYEMVKGATYLGMRDE